MPHTIAADLTSNLRSQTHRLARCFKVVRFGVTDPLLHIRVTSHDAKISIPEGFQVGGLSPGYSLDPWSQTEFSAESGRNHWTQDSGWVYTPIDAFSATAARAEAAMKAANIELQGVVGSGLITKADILAGKWDKATVHDFWVDWKYPWRGPMRHMVYRLSDFRLNDDTWTAQCVNLMSELHRKRGKSYAKTCWHSFGDSGCGVNTEALGVTKFRVKATTVTSQTQLVIANADGSSDNAHTKADNYFRAGQVVSTSGNNIYQAYPVRKFENSGAILHLQYPPRGTIVVNDTFTLYAGCDKNATTCVTTWNNWDKFGGFPQIPGTTKIAVRSGNN